MAQRDLVRLVDAQAVQRSRIRDALAAAIASVVLGWADFYTPTGVRRLVSTLVQLIEEAQTRTVAATDAYLARVLGELTGRPTAPVGVRVDPTRLRGTVDHDEVLGRVAAEFRRRRADGMDEAQARERAARRARLIADDDVTLAAREAARQVYTTTPGITGYRRVIRPELSESGTCGLCVAAADRRYSRGDLLPIHARCRCDTLPILGANDPGRSMNEDELAELYAAAGGTHASGLSNVRYTVHQHGELGPVLRESGEHFRGPSEVAADTAAA